MRAVFISFQIVLSVYYPLDAFTITPHVAVRTHHRLTNIFSPPQPIYATTEETETTTQKTTPSSVTITKKEESSKKKSEKDGLPWWWDFVWKLDLMKRGQPGTEIIFGDSAHVLRTNIEQIYGGYPSPDGCPLAEGAITDIADGTMFIGLQRYYQNYGSPYKLCFGPKSFLVISDPVQAKHILREANGAFDKGVLAEILEPIMGKGLIFHCA